MPGRNKKRLANLILANGHRCHWCTCPVQQMPGGWEGRQPPWAATLDHLITRVQSGKYKGEPRPVVVSCHHCNNMRGGISEADFLHRIATGRHNVHWWHSNDRLWAAHEALMRGETFLLLLPIRTCQCHNRGSRYFCN